MIAEHVAFAGGVAQIRFTDAGDGDFAVAQDPPGAESRRAAIHPAAWTWLRQVHGADLVRVDTAGAGSGTEADAAVTSANDAPISILTADCAPVVLIGDGGQLGVVHAGWRGVMAGVISATVGELRSMGAATVHAVIGPCIGPECYEFSADDLDLVRREFGDAVAATTREGSPALDLRAAVTAQMTIAGMSAENIRHHDRCTACHGRTGSGTGTAAGDAGADSGAARYYSHRARGDHGRQTTVAWRTAHAANQ